MTTLLEQFLRRMSEVKVYALIGKSGTGKSFRARLIAERYRIPLIVDDGLLIRDQTIIAGRSAKNAANYLAAVKTAVFTDPEHRREVLNALHGEKFSKILLLGTSEKMIRRLREQLELPPLYKILRIEEVASGQEIQKALMERREGRHVIPAPPLEVRRDHSHILQENVLVFFERAFGFFRKRKTFEKSVVQPIFHQEGLSTGKLVLSESALGEMIIHCVDEFDSSLKVVRLKVRSVKRRMTGPAWKLILGLEAPYGRDLTTSLHQLQDFITQHILRYTGFVIESVDVEIVRIS